MQEKRHEFLRGAKDGIPIALGYLAVSFGLGISAKNMGLPVWAAVLMSVTNLTSAGEAAGIAVIAASGSLVEMALTQFVINLRYALMGLSLTQKLDGSYTLPHRLLTSYAITDEVFAVSVSRPGKLSPPYMYGLISLPVLGWTAGTLLGAAAGELLPPLVGEALGLAIYGMFIAIVLPPAKKDKGVCCCVVLSALLSCCLRYIPVFSGITQGFAIILCAVIASALMAVLFPRKEEGQ